MREYMWRRRQSEPDRELWARAKYRAKLLGVPFDLAQGSVIIPTHCPALGIPLVIGQKRSGHSPSLDRIEPTKGYVQGNVRVISDKANKLKGTRNAEQLRSYANVARGHLQKDLLLIAEYVEREELLTEVMKKANPDEEGHEAWANVARFLENVFSRGELTGPPDTEDLREVGLSDFQRFLLRLTVPHWHTDI
ncbi:hypothetical protein ACWPM1_11040 [Tsuneonella sp. HG249]